MCLLGYLHSAWCRMRILRILIQESHQLAGGLPSVKQVGLSVVQTEESTTRPYTGEGFLEINQDQGTLHIVLVFNMG